MKVPVSRALLHAQCKGRGKERQVGIGVWVPQSHPDWLVGGKERFSQFENDILLKKRRHSSEITHLPDLISKVLLLSWDFQALIWIIVVYPCVLTLIYRNITRSRNIKTELYTLFSVKLLSSNLAHLYTEDDSQLIVIKKSDKIREIWLRNINEKRKKKVPWLSDVFAGKFCTKTNETPAHQWNGSGQ